jgi:hypothetical protein
VPPGETGGTAFFFIEHRSPADALPIAPPIADEDATVSHVAGLTVETADLGNATQLWQQRVGLTQGTVEGGVAFLLGNAGLVVFSGVGEGPTPHRWVRLVLSRRGLTSLADRLDNANVRFEQGDFREGYGIRTEVSGADVLITEG